ncbi:MAG: response regulator transcription factor [Flavobacterium sp.]|nr:response regulator transcription factor [Flavobacterium sp.]
MKVRLLIIEDHPAMIAGYKSILSFNKSGYDVEITATGDCAGAHKILTDPNPLIDFDVIFVDVILPADEQRKLYSGEDLAVLARKYLPHSKIIMLTSHTEAFVLYSLIKKVNPEGLLVKSDFSPEDLLTAFEEIIKGGEYRSDTVRKTMRDMLKSNAYFDSHNRKIIYLLSQGVKTKNMPAHLGLSISAIDKRKSVIKGFFGIEKGTDEDIINAARRNGFV